MSIDEARKVLFNKETLTYITRENKNIIIIEENSEYVGYH